MKKLFSTIMVVLVATVASYAQTIAVVSSSGSTTMHQTLADAIDKAASGSVIYLPGGGFQLSDDTKITKKLTIMGVSHRADTDNAEGATTIAGNVWFNQGSDGSAIMGCYVSGDVHVGEDEAVTNLTLKYCNVNFVKVHSSGSTGLHINQCYLRDGGDFGYCNVIMENNIIRHIRSVDGGKIDHNIITANKAYVYSHETYAFYDISSTTITNNFILNGGSIFIHYRNNQNSIMNNCKGTQEWGEDCITLEAGQTWDDVFESWSYDVKVTSDYHLKGTIGKGKGTNGTDIGIYLNSAASTGFDDHALAPIPRIISKEISEQTDADGKLNIKITVKAK